MSLVLLAPFAIVSRPKPSPRFFIVVPTRNSENFIDSCLNSIYSQRGNFNIQVHVQDCCSTDATIRIVRQWQQVVGESLTVCSEHDNGIYDAVLRGAKNIQSDDTMTWLGSDDIFMPGAFATVVSIFSEHDRVDWITGLPYVGNEAGECYTPWETQSFSRLSLSSGHCDGRTANFVMQEGTFWRGSLWLSAGGLDPRFKLAGDWDLWRRFALRSPLFSLTFPLARFTKREGQTSSDMSAYYAEVDGTPSIAVVNDRAEYRITRYAGQTGWHIKCL